MYSVEDASTGELYALKKILCQDSEAREIAEKEIRVLQSLRGEKHIIQYVAHARRECVGGGGRHIEYLILMELCTGGSLIHLIQRRNNRPLSERQIAELFTQICRGIRSMHRQQPPMAHRDMKIENVLLTGRGEVRICDFGSVSQQHKAYTTQREIVEQEEIIQKYSTNMYRAPEACDLYRKQRVSEKVDVWALVR